MTSHNCEITGDVAHAETYVIWVLRHKDRKTVRVGGGRYLDRLEKRDGDWRIALRRLIIDWQFDADGTSFNADNGYENGTWDRTDSSYARPLNLPLDAQQRLAAARKAKGG
jgi:hypothetical protein